MQFIRRTLLYQRIQESYVAYRELRRAQHRASLKAKRAAVRARVHYEVQKLQMERAMLRVEAAKAVSRVQSVARVVSIMDKRREKIRSKLEEAGEEVPEGLFKGVNSAERKFKEGVLKRVEGVIDKAGEIGVGVGGRVAKGVLKDVVEGVDLGDVKDDAERNLKMVAGVARTAGVGWEEMEKLVEIVEPDVKRREELRKVVRNAMQREGGIVETEVGGNR